MFDKVLKVMVVEDQRLLREAISALIDLEEGLHVVAQCENACIALSCLNSLAQSQEDEYPDIILSDIEMPDMSGIELAEKLAKEKSQAKVVIMTTFSRPGYIKRALKAGVLGFILKEAPSEYLIASIREVAKGDRVISPELALMALDDKDPLSDKERKALKLGLDGLSTQEIADKLFLSVGTVRNYLSEAISKLDASNRVDAARIAQQKGWL